MRSTRAGLRSALDAANAGTWDWDLLSQKIVWSRGHEAVFGYSPGTFRGTYAEFDDRLHQDDREALTQAVERARDAKEAYSHEYRVVWPDGSTHWVLARGMFDYDADGRAIRMRGMVVETTKQRLAERAQRESEEQWRVVFEHLATPCFVTDESGVITACNPSFQEAFAGRAHERLQGQSIQSFLVQPEGWRDLIALLSEKNAVHFRAKQMRTRAGEVRHAILNLVAIRPDEGRPLLVYGNLIDDTCRVDLESQLGQAARLEALGRLSAGVAHDFNNLLSVVMGNGELALKRLDRPGDLAPLIRDILDACERASMVTRQLLAFGRKQALSPIRVDLHELTRGTLALLERLLPGTIRIEASLSREPCIVFADPTQIEQVVMNLVINARDAMPHGGTVCVGTTLRQAGEAAADPANGSASPRRLVTLHVSDSGVGIEQRIQAHIFEPFFTTKDSGKGSGLGLATVHGIVRQSGGQIEVESEPGVGATFRVTLPVCDACEDLLPAKGLGSASVPGGTEFVLVVEDDPRVNAVLCAMLRSLGYRATGVASADAVREAAQEHDVDLVLSDGAAQGAADEALFDALRELRPRARLLLVSGSRNDASPAAGCPTSLAKPFTLLRLGQAVRAALDGR